MKKTNTIYWISTALFAAFMSFSGVPDILMIPQAIDFMSHLGYPNYFIPFIGAAKVLGSIAILIPGYPRIKEWAYAGLTFDLVGAVYSVAATDGLSAGMFGMALPFCLLILSYRFHHKRLATMA